jgi:hypothetical protein
MELATKGFDLALFDIDRPPEAIPPKEREAEWAGLPSVLAEVQGLGRDGLVISGI